MMLLIALLLSQTPDAGTVTVGPSHGGALEIPLGASVPAPAGGAAVCDNLAIVGVSETGGHLELTGLKLGQTTCGFRRTPQSPPTVIEVKVVQKKAPKLPKELEDPEHAQ